MALKNESNLNVRAFNLNVKLHALCYELGNLATAARNTIDFDAAEEFVQAVDAVIAAQVKLAACDLSIDAARDAKDQSYATPGK